MGGQQDAWLKALVAGVGGILCDRCNYLGDGGAVDAMHPVIEVWKGKQVLTTQEM